MSDTDTWLVTYHFFTCLDSIIELHVIINELLIEQTVEFCHDTSTHDNDADEGRNGKNKVSNHRSNESVYRIQYFLLRSKISDVTRCQVRVFCELLGDISCCYGDENSRTQVKNE